MITEINVEWEKSDRLTVAKLNTVKHFNKQDHKSKLMTEKYSLLPLNPQQLTPVQTAIQRMSEKHPDFEIEPVNTIRPPEIKYNFVLLHWMAVFHQLCTDKCHKNEWNLDTLLRDLVPGLVILNYG